MTSTCAQRGDRSRVILFATRMALLVGLVAAAWLGGYAVASAAQPASRFEHQREFEARLEPIGPIEPSTGIESRRFALQAPDRPRTAGVPDQRSTVAAEVRQVLATRSEQTRGSAPPVNPTPDEESATASGSRTSEPGLSEPGLSEPGLSEPGLSEPGRAEPGRAEPGRAEPGRAEPGRAEPGRADAAERVERDIAEHRAAGRLHTVAAPHRTDADRTADGDTPDSSHPLPCDPPSPDHVACTGPVRAPGSTSASTEDVPQHESSRPVAGRGAQPDAIAPKPRPRATADRGEERPGHNVPAPSPLPRQVPAPLPLTSTACTTNPYAGSGGAQTASTVAVHGLSPPDSVPAGPSAPASVQPSGIVPEGPSASPD
ncbi:hypothetical protein [Haloactinomyces albus]|uniref:Uncharacterized protein n=1 Tax=Haloactinomyces albus TaxID=1352928 RepID=A0AAE3ZEY5_9ACTN|nr:hypothetical protein [Haloactinomyces albus]MDR7302314.1 hypothetical protein [Haloactinomyces albus]